VADRQPAPAGEPGYMPSSPGGVLPLFRAADGGAQAAPVDEGVGGMGESVCCGTVRKLLYVLLIDDQKPGFWTSGDFIGDFGHGKMDNPQGSYS
jgi:hypothetical protein